MGEWDRARLAYRHLLGGADPVADLLAGGDAVDLRPAGIETIGETAGELVVVSGPDDLLELRAIVESIAGTGTWPVPPPPSGETRRGSVELASPGPALRLVAALEGLVDDRGGMWRTWKTTTELVAARAARLRRLTVEAVVVSRPAGRGGRPPS